jgi:hypothetical protein
MDAYFPLASKDRLHRTDNTQSEWSPDCIHLTLVVTLQKNFVVIGNAIVQHSSERLLQICYYLILLWKDIPVDQMMKYE